MLKNFDMPDGDTCLNLDQDQGQDQENLIAARARYVLALEGLSPLDRLDAQLRGQLEHAIDRIDEKLAAMGVQLSAKAP